MGLIKRCKKIWRGLCPFSKGVLKLAAGLMGGCYGAGAFALYLAPQARNFSGTMAMASGYFEAAPACLAAGVCAALIIDLVTKKDLKDC